MADGIYVSMSGASARARALEAISDNLANVETTGFRAARPRFEAFLPSGSSKAAPAFAVTADAPVDTRPGPARATERPLDVRVANDAYLVVAAPDGTEAYTRDGGIVVDAEGQLLVGGRPLLGSLGPLQVTPGATVSIGDDGTVRADGDEVGTILTRRLPAGATRIAGGLVAPIDGKAEDTPAQLRVGELEGSNASALDATVALIEAQRAFDHAMQAIQTSRRLDERVAELARVRG